MPTTDKFSKKVVSTTIINRQPNLNNDRLLVKTVEKIETVDAIDELSELNTELIKFKPEEELYEIEYVWRNIIFFVLMHCCIPYAFYQGAKDLKFYLFVWRKYFCDLRFKLIKID